MYEFTTLTLQIPNLTDEDMLLHFMDGLKIGPRRIGNADRSGRLMTITQAEALTVFRQEKSYSAGGDDIKGSHDNGGGDHGECEEQRLETKRQSEEQRPQRNDTIGPTAKSIENKVTQ